MSVILDFLVRESMGIAHFLVSGKRNLGEWREGLLDGALSKERDVRNDILCASRLQRICVPGHIPTSSAAARVHFAFNGRGFEVNGFGVFG